MDTPPASPSWRKARSRISGSSGPTRVLAGLGRIKGIKCARPEGAFYVYPNISAFLGGKGLNSPAEFARKLLHDAHVASVPGEGFGTQEHIRLSYATSQKELDRGLERLKRFVESL